MRTAWPPPMASSSARRPRLAPQRRHCECHTLASRTLTCSFTLTEARHDPPEALRLAYQVFSLVFRSLAARGSWGHADGERFVDLEGEEDSIDRSCTVLVTVIRRCLPASPHRARWPVSSPSSARPCFTAPTGRDRNDSCTTMHPTGTGRLVRREGPVVSP